MKTVAQEMSPEERAKRLVHGLKATGEDEVAVCFSHLAHALGMDEAEKLVKGGVVEMHGLMPARNARKPTLIREGTCVVDRVAALEAIEKKMIDSKLVDQKDKDSIVKAIKS